MMTLGGRNFSGDEPGGGSAEVKFLGNLAFKQGAQRIRRIERLGIELSGGDLSVLPENGGGELGLRPFSERSPQFILKDMFQPGAVALEL